MLECLKNIIIFVLYMNNHVHNLKIQKMGNQQLYVLTTDLSQLFLTAKLGDGHLTTPKNINSNSYYSTNCKFKEYLEFKSKILGDLSGNINYIEKNGYSQTPIFSLISKRDDLITHIRNLSLEETILNLNELGIALWFYDDGSLHKNKLFYNLNTQKFSYDIQKELFIPFFNRYNIFPKITEENKKDGRIFYYLRISKYEGAYEISRILEKYPLECYKYKLWSPETIQKWSKLQAELKSRAIVASYKRLSNLLELDTIEDIVQSLEKSKAGITEYNLANYIE